MWFRRHRDDPDEHSQEALEDAQRNLGAIQRRGAEVSEIAQALKEFRERNHFAEKLEEIIIRRRGSTT